MLSLRIEIDTSLLPLQMSTSSFPRDVDPVAESGRIDWDKISSGHNDEEVQGFKAGEAIETFAEGGL